MPRPAWSKGAAAAACIFLEEVCRWQGQGSGGCSGATHRQCITLFTHELPHMTAMQDVQTACSAALGLKGGPASRQADTGPGTKTTTCPKLSE